MKKETILIIKIGLLLLNIVEVRFLYFTGLVSSFYSLAFVVPYSVIVISVLSLIAAGIDMGENKASVFLNRYFNLHSLNITLLIINVLLSLLPIVFFVAIYYLFDALG